MYNLGQKIHNRTKEFKIIVLNINKNCTKAAIFINWNHVFQYIKR